MDGYLLVDKPAGWTSFDVVAKVRSTLSKDGIKTKVGHSGTLDPMATGLLLLLIGNYTKYQAKFTNLDKTYDAKIQLGATSTTDDLEGEVKKITGLNVPTKKQILGVVNSFLGEIEQVPPKHSAIKVDGKRAYKLARGGSQFELKPRLVKVYEIEDIRYKWPELSMNCRVSSGTYIRSLARDIGQKLGTMGYLSALRRTQIGPYLVSDAIDVNELNTELIRNHLRSKL